VLVHSYLRSSGYIETLQAFTNDSMIDTDEMIIEPGPASLTRMRSMSAVVSENVDSVQLSEENNMCGICGNLAEVDSIIC
jgi:hypothetical protein